MYIFRNSVVSSDRITCCQCCFRSWIQINWLQTSGGLLVSVPNARALRRSWWHLWSLQHAQSHWCLQQQLVPQIKKAAIRDILLQSFSLFKLSMFAWQFPLAIEFARLLQSEDMYSGTSWAVVGLSSVALTKTYVCWHLRCGFVIFVFWLWLCAGLYCHFIEARLVSWLRRMTEPQKKDPDSDYTKDYEDMKLYPGQK